MSDYQREFAGFSDQAFMASLAEAEQMAEGVSDAEFGSVMREALAEIAGTERLFSAKVSDIVGWAWTAVLVVIALWQYGVIG